MNDPRAENIRLWLLDKNPDDIWPMGHAIVMASPQTVQPIAFCSSPLVAQALVEALHIHIRKEKIRREIFDEK